MTKICGAINRKLCGVGWCIFASLGRKWWVPFKVTIRYLNTETTEVRLRVEDVRPIGPNEHK